MKKLIKTPSAWLPIVMSVAVLALVLGYVAVFGVVHQEDEGTAAHLPQFLMVGQVPIMVFFAVKWLPKIPKQALQVLFIQIVVVLIAFAPIYFLEM